MAYSIQRGNFKMTGSAPSFPNNSPLQVEVCGGYDLDFVNLVHERFICPICLKVMREPNLVVCCGKKYCHSCLKNYRMSKKDACPNCLSLYGITGFRYVKEKGMENEIESFVVRCPMKGKGCEWEGEVKEVGSHLRSLGGCGAFEVQCPNQCKVGRKGVVLKLPRRSLSHHLSYQCELRQIQCPHCDYQGPTKSYSIHETVCMKFPIACPNGCYERNLVRQMLPAHRLACSLEVISCEYSIMGCKEHVKRKDMPQHMKEYLEQHMEMVTQSNLKLRQELDTVMLRMKALTAEADERKVVVQQELALLENRVSGDRLWLNSLNALFKDPRNLSNEELYFRMFRYKDIRTGIKDWNSPAFKVHDSDFCLKVTSCADVTSLTLYICLMTKSKDSETSSLPLLWTESLIIRVKKQGSVALPQPPVQNKFRLASLKSRQSSFSMLPLKDVEFSWKMPENFTMANCKREGTAHVLHSCKMAISQEWEKIHVQDDSLVWTICMSM